MLGENFVTSIKKINIGILGAANIATRSVIPALCSLKETYTFSSIASRNEESLKTLKNSYHIQTYTSYKKLLEEANIDAVYIPLPTGLHYPWVKSALEKKLHVLVEKSLATTHEESQELNTLAKKNNLVLLENFQFRCHPQYKFLVDIINSKELGELRCLRASFGFPPFASKDNIRYKPELGGGALLDAGAYTTKISQLLLGEDLKVRAASLHYDSSLGVSLYGGAYLENQQGISSQIAFGFDNQYQCGIELWGSKGLLKTNRLFTAPENFEPEFSITNSSSTKIFKVEKANHFVEMLKYFQNLIFNQKNLEKEYSANNDQARLLSEILKKSSL